MLMRNPEYQFEVTQKSGSYLDEPLAANTAREMFLGQLVLLLLFMIAILLQSMI